MNKTEQSERETFYALLAESDEKRDAAMKEKLKFLSTLSLRRATPAQS